LLWWKSAKADDEYDDEESEDDGDDDDEYDDFVGCKFISIFGVYFCSRVFWLVFGVVRCMKCQCMYVLNDWS
jgi:hypothetical protein